jgi:pSer/pThr/pTyr-binding forkhead associated (FHA) protein
MKVSLVVMTAGKAKGQSVPINLPQFIIGRDPQCNLRPASAVISKRHCAILIKDGQVSVRDFNSTNGTFVNDVPVTGEAPLKHDDVLKLGPLEFKMIVETKPTVSKPTPLPRTAKTPAAPAAKSDDDSVAAMLLSLQEDGAKEKGEDPTTPNEDEVPAGSTVMDLVALKAAASAETPSPETPKPPAPKKPDPKNDPAHLAAKAILDKYNRRTR